MSYAPDAVEAQEPVAAPAARRRSLRSHLGDPLARLPIRTRLAAVSTALTLVILCGFATVVGELTARRLRSDFYSQVASAATALSGQLRISFNPTTGAVTGVTPSLTEFAAPEHAAIRIVTDDGVPFLSTPHAPYLGPVSAGANQIESDTVGGYHVENRPVTLLFRGAPFGGIPVVVQYGRRISDLDATVARLRLLLLLGVLAGTGLALLAGTMIARRAMAPIARLTGTAREIARTRDPSRAVVVPDTDDEVAELARTFEDMLRSLDSARGETEAMLAQQRAFVADASHELRTPLTSVLANLELLADSLHGEQGEAARSALRSSQRMRRLVADLLLLARTDAGREARRAPVDLAEIVLEAVAELGSLASDHSLLLDAAPIAIDGVHDDLLRLAINLIENAVRHTPPGTSIAIETRRGPSGEAELIVEDDGPGVPPELAPRLFERFVRGVGDRGGSSGLGLAIVQAVAAEHGGTVALEQRGPGVTESSRGARFVVRLPARPADAAPVSEARPAAPQQLPTGVGQGAS